MCFLFKKAFKKGLKIKVMLLISRDYVVLKPIEGQVVSKPGLPEKLQLPFVVMPKAIVLAPSVNQFNVFDVDQRNNNLEQVIIDVNQTKVLNPGFMTGFWSGYRSAVILEGDSMYRLKGVAFDPERPEIRLHDLYWDVYGGQFRKDIRFEQKMSNRFNRVLKEEGIEPAMEYLGHWNYEIKVKEQTLAASLFKVKGDTRLDEFVITCEKLRHLTAEISKQEKVKLKNFQKKVHCFFGEIGFIVGRLKRLMDKSGQTWSCKDVYGAHSGNIVLYEDGDHLRINFVDFDSSCDKSEMSRSQLRDLQRDEYNNLLENFNSIDMNLFGARPIMEAIPQFYDQRLGQKMILKFNEGYHSRRNGYDNKIAKEQLQEIIGDLRIEGLKIQIHPKSTKYLI